jgi:hypothetical protein
VPSREHEESGFAAGGLQQALAGQGVGALEAHLRDLRGLAQVHVEDEGALVFVLLHFGVDTRARIAALQGLLEDALAAPVEGVLFGQRTVESVAEIGGRGHSAYLPAVNALRTAP